MAQKIVTNIRVSEVLARRKARPQRLIGPNQFQHHAVRQARGVTEQMMAGDGRVLRINLEPGKVSRYWLA